MDIQKIKSLLTLEKLEGKGLQIGGEVLDLDTFIYELDRLDGLTYSYSLDLCRNDYALNFGENGLLYHLDRCKYNQVKIFSTIIGKNLSSIPPTEVAIESFGTNK